MRNKRKKNIAINILIVILMQVALNVLTPIKAIAAEETVTIQCNDVNFYNGLVSNLGDKVQSKDDENKTISMTKTNIESVTRISISGSNKKAEEKIKDITGIEKFTNLIILNFEYNQISNISAISGLMNLKNLNLRYNQISDISAISGLTNLTGLNLIDNHISEISAISRLTNLTDLSLGSNQISEISVLSGLTNLTGLALYENQISDISVLSGLTNLRDLDMSYNQISDISVLSGLTNLTDLDLESNQISEISAISGLTNLTKLYLSWNLISEISAISGLTNLKNLHLDGNQIREISEISGLTNLIGLYLRSNQIGEISEISGLTNLIELWLDENQISEISAISRLTNLKRLVLDENQISDINAISGLTNLTYLSLSDNQISDISVISGLTNLTTLDLGYQTIEKIVGKEGVQEIELPQIIKAAKDSNSKIYTEKDYILTNCTLSSDGTKIIVDTDNVEKASIKIDGGKATGTYYNVIVEDTIPPEIEVKNSITTLTNQNVTVTITANEEIQEVEGWTLSAGKTILTKEYTENGEETVEVKDLAGNKTTANVKVDNIDKVSPIVTMKNSITTQTNQNVTVTITANEEIQGVEGWTLGSDKKTLTKTYSENKSETVTITDLAGNTTTASIVVNNIDKTAPKVTVKYSTVNPTNENVTVTITSDEEIQAVAGWKLDSSKKILTKEYVENGEETVEITDLAGNKTTANVKVANIDKIAPRATIKYSTENLTNQNVIVTITADEEIKAVEGWTLGSDKKTLTKTYSENKSEIVTITDLAGNTTTASIVVNNINKIVPKVTIKYSTVNPTNQNVVVTIISDKEVQAVSGWTLDSSKKILTKEYTSNKEEEITIKDLLGNTTKASIKVANIDKTKPEANVSYSKTTATNENIIVTITTNEEIKAVSGWTLGSDKKTLTKTYSENKSEIVTIIDLAGNTTTASIVVNNIDKTVPKVTIKYSTVNPTNQNVIVTITSDKEIQELTGWTLDKSKKILTKEYTENKEEEIEIKDLVGNTVKANIKITNIDKVKPEVKVSYSNTEQTYGKVKVEITPNEEIQIPKGWILDEEKNTIYKEYDANTEETVTIVDLAGNETNVKIKIDNIIKNSSGNNNSGNNNEENEINNNKDNTISNIAIPKAGIGMGIIIAIILLLACGIVTYKKYGKYRDIK